MRRREGDEAPGRRRGRSLGLAVLAVAVAAGAVAILRSEDEPALGPLATTASPERRFIRVGTTDGTGLSDDEVAELSSHYGYVLFAKFHAGWDIEQHHEDARRLKAANPDVRVLPYFSTKYWFDDNDWGVEIDPDWLLRDNDGELVAKRRGGEEQDDGRLIDLANADYRDWALSVMADWLATAPYDGISFDAADPIGDEQAEEIELYTGLLGTQRIEAYNDGIEDLLRRATALVGPGKEVVYNGIAPNPMRGPGRDLHQLEVTDGALDEKFCVDRKGAPLAIDEDLDLMADITDDSLFLRTNLPDDLSDEDRARTIRLCTGVFLLGWVPGRTFFQMADSYTVEQLSEDIPDVEVAVGRPVGPMVGTTLRSRPYEHGLVVVNLGDEPASFSMPRALTAVEEGRRATTYEAGEEVVVAADDALLLVDPDPTG